MTRTRTSLVFDFDGTVSLGNGPLRAYAVEVIAAMGDWEGAAAVEAAAMAPWSQAGPGGEPARDGYDAIRIAAVAHGATEETLQSAYTASRELLATDRAPIVAPHGLADLLDRVAPHAWRVLATNAPSTRIHDALGVLGLGGRFDDVRTDLGKPAGLAALVSELADDGPVLCVGDVWDLDLAPAQALGAATALVCASGLVPKNAQPDFVGETLADVSHGIESWLAQHGA